MSIYSGFPTRQLQEHYDETLATLLFILQKRICKFYTEQSANEVKFIQMVCKLHNTLRKLQQSKYLEPKSSGAVTQLVNLLKSKKDYFVEQSISQSKANALTIQKQMVQSQISVKESKLQKSNDKFTVTERQAVPSAQQVVIQTSQKIQPITHLQPNDHHKQQGSHLLTHNIAKRRVISHAPSTTNHHRSAIITPHFNFQGNQALSISQQKIQIKSINPFPVQQTAKGNSHTIINQNKNKKLTDLNKPITYQFTTPKSKYNIGVGDKMHEQANHHHRSNLQMIRSKQKHDSNNQVQTFREIYREKQKNNDKGNNKQLHNLASNKYHSKSKFQEGEITIQRGQSKQDVRDLIKGYLIKKKRHQLSSEQNRKQEIEQIFKPA